LVAVGGGNGSDLHKTVSWDDNRKIKSAWLGRATGNGEIPAPWNSERDEVGSLWCRCRP